MVADSFEGSFKAYAVRWRGGEFEISRMVMCYLLEQCTIVVLVVAQRPRRESVSQGGSPTEYCHCGAILQHNLTRTDHQHSVSPGGPTWTDILNMQRCPAGLCLRLSGRVCDVGRVGVRSMRRSSANVESYCSCLLQFAHLKAFTLDWQIPHGLLIESPTRCKNRIHNWLCVNFVRAEKSPLRTPRSRLLSFLLRYRTQPPPPPPPNTLCSICLEIRLFFFLC